VARAGQAIFGDKLVALTEFLPLADYQRLLAGIDIGIFNFRRQQALGNIITLLGLGRKVVLRRDVSTWELLTRLGIEVHDVRSFRPVRLDPEAARRNAEIVRARFSAPVLAAQLAALFAG
jgi:hypothetical protein